jgi:hypothetical protein
LVYPLFHSLLLSSSKLIHFFSQTSLLFSLSCCSPFFWNVSFVTALSFLHIISFGTGKRNIIEKGTTQNIQRTKQGGKIGEERNLARRKVQRSKGGEQRDIKCGTQSHNSPHVV